MKYKKTLIVGVFFGIASSVPYCSTTNTSSDDPNVAKLRAIKSDNGVDFSQVNWLRQFPQLESVPVGEQTAEINKLRVSESISELIGPINNPYGVRDDVLYAIMEVVPESNHKQLQAAIKSAYYATLSGYAIADEDKLKYIRRESLSVGCMYGFDVDKENYDTSDNVMKILSTYDRNTSARKKYIRNLEETVFAWQLLGDGYGLATEQKKCRNGDY